MSFLSVVSTSIALESRGCRAAGRGSGLGRCFV